MTYAERRIAEVMAETGNRKFAASEAKVSYSSGAVDKAMQRPAVLNEIARIQTEKLFSELLPLAVRVHAEILADPKAPAGARVQAVKLAYDRTLGAQDGAQAKEPHEMTAEEIAEAIGKLEAIAIGRAKTVESAQPVPNYGDMFS
ncbi:MULTISPECIES: hypothetical protein [unclassified Shinella]|uniref:hypothetical protein n=1 Tax=unclassified Shinella TaxID=2643062 RepID=UPI00308D373E|nr:protein of unknown function [Shinella sp. WSC3-e]